MSDEKKKVSGLRSAVRYGHLTVDEASAKFNRLTEESGYTSKDFVRWLLNFKRRGAKPVETVETSE